MPQSVSQEIPHGSYLLTPCYLQLNEWFPGFRRVRECLEIWRQTHVVSLALIPGEDTDEYCECVYSVLKIQPEGDGRHLAELAELLRFLAEPA